MPEATELPPLASVADVQETIGGDLDVNEAHLERLLTSASAAVRDATGQILSRATTTVPVVVDDRPRVRLYQHPVVAVEQIQLDGRDLDGWALIGGELDRPGGWAATRRTVYVTYTHGYDPVPQAIRDLVVQLVLAALAKLDDAGMLGAEPGVRQESISGNAYSVTYGSDDPSPSSVFELSDRTRRWLRDTWGVGNVSTVTSR